MKDWQGQYVASRGFAPNPRLPQIAIPKLAVEEDPDGQSILYMGKFVDSLDLESLRPGQTVVAPLGRVADKGTFSGYELNDETFEWLNTNAGEKGWQYVLVETQLDRAVFFVYKKKIAALFRMFFG